MDNAIIAIDNVSKKYGNLLALDQVSLNVKNQQIYALLGENGAGKTTLIRILLGLQKPHQGAVYLFGQDMQSVHESIYYRVGATIEYPSYYGNLTGYENLEIIRLLRKLEKKSIDEILELVNLTDAANKKVRSYSQGMKQRFAIATALIGWPELVILDEPTSGLDPIGIKEIRELIAGLPTTKGTTVFVSSHQLGEVQQLATHVGIISHGRLIFNGSTNELRQQFPAVIVIQIQEVELAAETLKIAGYEVATKGTHLEIIAKDGNPETINRLLLTKGLVCSEISVQHPSLENMYFSVIGRPI